MPFQSSITIYIPGSLATGGALTVLRLKTLFSSICDTTCCLKPTVSVHVSCFPVLTAEMMTKADTSFLDIKARVRLYMSYARAVDALCNEGKVHLSGQGSMSAIPRNKANFAWPQVARFGTV